MAWIRIESSVRTHPKFLKAGPDACWLWICAISYCQEGLTDGFVAESALDYLGVKNAASLASKLQDVGLFDIADGGFHVHDYLDHNKSAADVRGIQHERRIAGARGGSSPRSKPQKPQPLEQEHVTGQANIQQVAEASAKQVAKPSTSTVQLCTATNQIGTGTDVQPEAAPQRTIGAARPQTIIQPRRKDAAWEGPKVYVPQRAHRDFVALKNGDEKMLLDWYEAVSIEWTEGVHKSDEVGGDMFAFWRNRYSEKWPAAAAMKHSNGAGGRTGAPPKGKYDGITES